ncbi:MAG: ADP-ribosylglycohydrolase family protein [Deltaproteobacteria bacterium]|nr:ADP-ribosylglycohydrolase family protein [Deltaproteobacteria bacterium]
MTTKPSDHADRLARARLSLLGLSVGDAFGEQFFLAAQEALQRIAARVLPKPPWYWTDDTEMAISIVEVLRDFGRLDQDHLARGFALRYDQTRGYGGMAHHILSQIRQGQPWREVSKAVFRGEGSFGNGGAMRVAPVGAYFADEIERAAEEARLSAEVTHAHPEGQAGAIAVAVAAAMVWQGRDRPTPDPRAFLEAVHEHVPPGATRAGIRAAAGLAPGTMPGDAAGHLGSGDEVSAQDTVPFCLWSAATCPDSYEEAMWRTVSGLGDRDTTCAIVGGIVALRVGERGVPEEWVRAREKVPA